MRASGGQYYSRLDHLRGLAAFLVFFWHFVHMSVPAAYVPSFPPLSIAEEGHTGVALFMTLSGYLFAKLVGSNTVDMPKFLSNRFLRLAPLLLVVVLYHYVFHNYNLLGFIKGFLVSKSWPGGAWSVSVEVQFYLLFPFLIYIVNISDLRFLFFYLVATNAVRFGLWQNIGQVQYLSYWTIVGCIDYFIIGMFFARWRSVWVFGTSTLLIGLAGFIAVWHLFNMSGGFFHPSTSPLWIFLPTIQGLFWAVIIVSYERAAFRMPRQLDHAAAHVGRVSYSIYMIHIQIIDDVLKPFVHLTEFWLASLVCLASFPLFVGLSTMSYRCIEAPFLRWRVNYLKPADRPTVTALPTCCAPAIK